MTGQRTSPAALIAALILAFGLAPPLVALSGHLAPLGHVSGFEIGNDFVALLGLSFAAIQLVANRRSEKLRSAWALAALGAMMIAVEDHLAPVIAPGASRPLIACASGALWIAGASLIVECGRRYAMRLNVMTVMRTGMALTLAAVGLNLVHKGFGAGGHRIARLQDFAELAATVAMVAGLLMTQVAPLKSYRFTPGETGRMARRLFYDFGLETRLRYPAPVQIFSLSGFREGLLLGIILRYMPVAAGAVRRDYGVGYGRQLLDLLRLAFAEGIDAKTYYVQELYRPEAGLLDGALTRVETKNGLNKAIQSLRANRPGPFDMNDKLAFFRACETHGIPSAPIIATIEDGALVWMGERAGFDRDLFVKDRAGRGGCFTLNFERVGPFLYRADEGATIDLDGVARALRTASAGRQLIVQPKLRNHATIRSLANRSLAVFRVVTCIDQSGEPRVTHGVLRLLRRFEPDWPKTADADWGCAIDLETGAFGPMTGDAPATCTRWFLDHPVTGERVTGRLCEGWSDIAGVALAAHRVFSSRVLVGWDIGWTPDGPVILEGNSNPDVSYFQRVYRTPAGASPLGPLLDAHLATLAERLVEEASSVERRAVPAAG